MSLDQRHALVRDLLGALGWAAVIGGGIALGLSLGSLGADVPADSEMLVLSGLIVGAGTLVVRILMVGWKHRGALAGPPPSRTPAAAPSSEGGEDDDLAEDEAPAAVTARAASARGTRPSVGGHAKKPGPKKPAAKKPRPKKPRPD